jgi:hypothetical protein
MALSLIPSWLLILSVVGIQLKKLGRTPCSELSLSKGVSVVCTRKERTTAYLCNIFYGDAVLQAIQEISKVAALQTVYIVWGGRRGGS